MKPVDWRPYQPLAIEFLRTHKRANLFAGMGLGKTLIVETLVKELQTQECTLVLGPMRVARKVWSDEAAEWEHLEGLTVATITGTEKERLAALRTRAHIHTMNYENIVWLIDLLPAGQWPFKVVVADESNRLKSFRLRGGGRRAAALATIAHRAERWINMTGTPGANGLIDMWGPQWFVDRGAALTPSFTAFVKRWFYKSPHSGDYNQLLPFSSARREIEELLRPTTMSIRAKDWFDLADPIVTEVRVALPPAARTEYRRMARELHALIKGHKISAANAAVKSVKLLQLASGAIYHEDGTWLPVHDEKIEALRSIVNEAAGAPVLVSYEYRHELARILAVFPGARQLKSKRDEDDWNAGRIPVLVAHPKSAGHGLNLQHGGNILVYFGHTWRLEGHLQILERIGPMRQKQSGYDRPVFVYSIVADKTADEAVIARGAGKLSIMDALIESLKVTV